MATGFVFLRRPGANRKTAKSSGDFWSLLNCDAAWRTLSACAKGKIGSVEVDLDIRADDDRRWHMNGDLQPQLEGCLDIDLGFTPATNTLPIRRLALKVGERSAVRAAWLKIPELQLHPLGQCYEPVSEFEYRYESENEGSRSALLVNLTDLLRSMLIIGAKRVRQHESGVFLGQQSTDLQGTCIRISAALLSQ